MKTLYRKINNENQTLHTDEACTSEPQPFPTKAIRLAWNGNVLTGYEEGDELPEIPEEQTE